MGYERYPRDTARDDRSDDDYRRNVGGEINRQYGARDDFRERDRVGLGDGNQRGYYSAGSSGDFRDRGSRFDQSGQRPPADYNYDERGFFNRAGDEVRSWFGDEEAERRREQDQRYDQRYARGDAHDQDYHSWRSNQIASLDRDYDEYRRENQQRFHSEFGTWRTDRQNQRGLLSRVAEHQDVVGSDGEHVGTVDKVRGDRLILTKSDADANGRHHSVPSRWIDRVDDKVTLRKTADEAKEHWRDEERSEGRSAFFGGDQDRDEDPQGRVLNRSFSGTY